MHHFRKLGEEINSAGERVSVFTSNYEDMIEKLQRGNASFKNAIRRVLLWGAASNMVYGGVSYIKDAVKEMSDVETSLAQLRMVLNPLETDFDRMAKSALDMGKKYGTSVNGVLQVMKTFAQQGLKQTDIVDRSDTATLAANISTLSSVEATEALTSAMQVFREEGSQSMRFLDSWSEVESKHAITAEKMADAIKKAASAAKNAGVTFDELNGIVAAVGSVTRQSGKEVGTSLRFIFRRLFTEKGPKALGKIGIPVLEGSGELRKSFDVLGDLAGKWKDLTTAQKMNISQAIGGTRQYNTMLVLMDQWDEVLRGVRNSTNSKGSAERRNQEIMKTYAKQMEKVKAAATGLKMELGKVVLPTFKAGLKGVQLVIDMFTNIPGPIKAAAVGVSLFFTAFAKGASIFDGFAGSISKGGTLLSNLTSEFKKQSKIFSYESFGMGKATKDEHFGLKVMTGPAKRRADEVRQASQPFAEIGKSVSDFYNPMSKLLFLTKSVGNAYNDKVLGTFGRGMQKTGKGGKEVGQTLQTAGEFVSITGPILNHPKKALKSIRNTGVTDPDGLINALKDVDLKDPKAVLKAVRDRAKEKTGITDISKTLGEVGGDVKSIKGVKDLKNLKSLAKLGPLFKMIAQEAAGLSAIVSGRIIEGVSSALDAGGSAIVDNFVSQNASLIKSIAPLAVSVAALGPILKEVWTHYGKLSKSAQDYEKAQDPLRKKHEAEINSVRGLMQSYDALDKKVNDLRKAQEPDVKQRRQSLGTYESPLTGMQKLQEEAISVTNQLAEANVQLVSGYDSLGNAIIKSSNGFNSYLKNVEQAKVAAAKATELDIMDKFVTDLTQIDGVEAFKAEFKDIVESFPVIGEMISKGINVGPAKALELATGDLNKRINLKQKYPLATAADEDIVRLQKVLSKARGAYQESYGDLQRIKNDLTTPISLQGMSEKDITKLFSSDTFRKAYEVQLKVDPKFKLVDDVSVEDLMGQELLAALNPKIAGSLGANVEFTKAMFETAGISSRQEEADDLMASRYKDIYNNASGRGDKIKDVVKKEFNLASSKVKRDGLIGKAFRDNPLTVDPLVETAKAFTGRSKTRAYNNDIVAFMDSAADDFNIAGNQGIVKMKETTDGVYEAVLQYFNNKTLKVEEMALGDVQHLVDSIFPVEKIKEDLEYRMDILNTFTSGAGAGLVGMDKKDFKREFSLGERFFGDLSTSTLLQGNKGFTVSGQYGEISGMKNWQSDIKRFYMKPMDELKGYADQMGKLTDRGLEGNTPAMEKEKFETITSLLDVLKNNQVVLQFRSVFVDLMKEFSESERIIKQNVAVLKERAKVEKVASGLMAGTTKTLGDVDFGSMDPRELTAQQRLLRKSSSFSGSSLEVKALQEARSGVIDQIDMIQKALVNIDTIDDIAKGFGASLKPEELGKYIEKVAADGEPDSPYVEFTKLTADVKDNTGQTVDRLDAILENMGDGEALSRKINKITADAESGIIGRDTPTGRARTLEALAEVRKKAESVGDQEAVALANKELDRFSRMLAQTEGLEGGARAVRRNTSSTTFSRDFTAEEFKQRAFSTLDMDMLLTRLDEKITEGGNKGFTSSKEYKTLKDLQARQNEQPIISNKMSGAIAAALAAASAVKTVGTNEVVDELDKRIEALSDTMTRPMSPEQLEATRKKRDDLIDERDNQMKNADFYKMVTTLSSVSTVAVGLARALGMTEEDINKLGVGAVGLYAAADLASKVLGVDLPESFKIYGDKVKSAAKTTMEGGSVGFIDNLKLKKAQFNMERDFKADAKAVLGKSAEAVREGAVKAKEAVAKAHLDGKQKAKDSWHEAASTPSDAKDVVTGIENSGIGTSSMTQAFAAYMAIGASNYANTKTADTEQLAALEENMKKQSAALAEIIKQYPNAAEQVLKDQFIPEKKSENALIAATKDQSRVQDTSAEKQAVVEMIQGYLNAVMEAEKQYRDKISQIAAQSNDQLIKEAYLKADEELAIAERKRRDESAIAAKYNLSNIINPSLGRYRGDTEVKADPRQLSTQQRLYSSLMSNPTDSNIRTAEAIDAYNEGQKVLESMVGRINDLKARLRKEEDLIAASNDENIISLAKERHDELNTQLEEQVAITDQLSEKIRDFAATKAVLDEFSASSNKLGDSLEDLNQKIAVESIQGFAAFRKSMDSLLGGSDPGAVINITPEQERMGNKVGMNLRHLQSNKFDLEEAQLRDKLRTATGQEAIKIRTQLMDLPEKRRREEESKEQRYQDSLLQAEVKPYEESLYALEKVKQTKGLDPAVYDEITEYQKQVTSALSKASEKTTPEAMLSELKSRKGTMQPEDYQQEKERLEKFKPGESIYRGMSQVDMSLLKERRGEIKEAISQLPSMEGLELEGLVTDPIITRIDETNRILSTIAEKEFGLNMDPKSGGGGWFSRPLSDRSVKKASGGHIVGPGGPREDKIPAWLSNGEFVINTKSAKKLGYEALDYINKKGELPAFADGGGVNWAQPFNSARKGINSYVDRLSDDRLAIAEKNIDALAKGSIGKFMGGQFKMGALASAEMATRFFKSPVDILSMVESTSGYFAEKGTDGFKKDVKSILANRKNKADSTFMADTFSMGKDMLMEDLEKGGLGISTALMRMPLSNMAKPLVKLAGKKMAINSAAKSKALLKNKAVQKGAATMGAGSAAQWSDIKFSDGGQVAYRKWTDDGQGNVYELSQEQIELMSEESSKKRIKAYEAKKARAAADAKKKEVAKAQAAKLRAEEKAKEEAQYLSQGDIDKIISNYMSEPSNFVDSQAKDLAITQKDALKTDAAYKDYVDSLIKKVPERNKFVGTEVPQEESSYTQLVKRLQDWVAAKSEDQVKTADPVNIRANVPLGPESEEVQQARKDRDAIRRKQIKDMFKNNFSMGFDPDKQAVKFKHIRSKEALEEYYKNMPEAEKIQMPSYIEMVEKLQEAAAKKQLDGSLRANVPMGPEGEEVQQARKDRDKIKRDKIKAMFKENLNVGLDVDKQAVKFNHIRSKEALEKYYQEMLSEGKGKTPTYLALTKKMEEAAAKKQLDDPLRANVPMRSEDLEGYENELIDYIKRKHEDEEPERRSWRQGYGRSLRDDWAMAANRVDRSIGKQLAKFGGVIGDAALSPFKWPVENANIWLENRGDSRSVQDYVTDGFVSAKDDFVGRLPGAKEKLKKDLLRPSKSKPYNLLKGTVSALINNPIEEEYERNRLKHALRDRGGRTKYWEQGYAADGIRSNVNRLRLWTYDDSMVRRFWDKAKLGWNNNVVAPIKWASNIPSSVHKAAKDSEVFNRPGPVLPENFDFEVPTPEKYNKIPGQVDPLRVAGKTVAEYKEGVTRGYGEMVTNLQKGSAELGKKSEKVSSDIEKGIQGKIGKLTDTLYGKKKLEEDLIDPKSAVVQSFRDGGFVSDFVSHFSKPFISPKQAIMDKIASTGDSIKKIKEKISGFFGSDTIIKEMDKVDVPEDDKTSGGLVGWMSKSIKKMVEKLKAAPSDEKAEELKKLIETKKEEKKEADKLWGIATATEAQGSAAAAAREKGRIVDPETFMGIGPNYDTERYRRGIKNKKEFKKKLAEQEKRMAKSYSDKVRDTSRNATDSTWGVDIDKTTGLATKKGSSISYQTLKDPREGDVDFSYGPQYKNIGSEKGYKDSAAAGSNNDTDYLKSIRLGLNQAKDVLANLDSLEGFSDEDKEKLKAQIKLGKRILKSAKKGKDDIYDYSFTQSLAQFKNTQSRLTEAPALKLRNMRLKKETGLEDAEALFRSNPKAFLQYRDMVKSGRFGKKALKAKQLELGLDAQRLPKELKEALKNPPKKIKRLVSDTFAELKNRNKDTGQINMSELFGQVYRAPEFQAFAENYAANEVDRKASASRGWLGTTVDFFGSLRNKFKDGGMITGPGGPKDDKVLAALSPREFVVNASATAKNLELLKQLNEGKDIPGFANGGMVPSGNTFQGTSSPATSALNGGVVKVEIDTDELISKLEALELKVEDKTFEVEDKEFTLEAPETLTVERPDWSIEVEKPEPITVDVPTTVTVERPDWTIGVEKPDPIAVDTPNNISVTVERPDWSVGVEQPEPIVLEAPTVIVERPDWSVNVAAPEPITVTVERPDWGIDVNAPEPITVETPDPITVTVERPDWEISVETPEPIKVESINAIKVEQPSWTVGVERPDWQVDVRIPEDEITVLLPTEKIQVEMPTEKIQVEMPSTSVSIELDTGSAEAALSKAISDAIASSTVKVETPSIEGVGSEKVNTLAKTVETVQNRLVAVKNDLEGKIKLIEPSNKETFDIDRRVVEVVTSQTTALKTEIADLRTDVGQLSSANRRQEQTLDYKFSDLEYRLRNTMNITGLI